MYNTAAKHCSDRIFRKVFYFLKKSFCEPEVTAMYLSKLIFSRTDDIKSTKRDSFLFNAFVYKKYFPSIMR